MNAPITVLMSVYNGERWLHESIESVLGQTHGDFEFIIVNDGSKDASLEIIKDFAASDQRILIIDKQNTGLADSLNVGINKAAGEWIARIDADDLCAPNRLALQYATLRARKEIILIGSGLVEIDFQGQVTKTFSYPDEHQILVRRLLAMKSFFAHSSACFRTEAARSIGGYRSRIRRAEDYDMWLRLSEIGKIGCIPEPLVHVRHHAEQISHDEGGRRQMIDARVALVSHFLRQKGFRDPVAADSTDGEFVMFRHFVERGVDQDKLVEFRRFISEIKARREIASFADVCVLLGLTASAPDFVFRYIRQTLFGEELAVRLLTEWSSKEISGAHGKRGKGSG